MLLAAAASGWAPSGAGCSRAAPGRSSSACGCPRRRRRRRRGRRAGTAASVARGRAALALRSPSATRAVEATRAFTPARSEPPGGFRTTRSRPGTGYSAALRDSTHLAPNRYARARRSGGRAVTRVQAPRPGRGRRRRRRAYCCFARRPACLRAKRHPSRENENRRTARGNRTPTAGTRVPSHSFRPERLCEVDTGGRVSVHATL